LTPFHCRNFDQVLRDGFGDVDHMRRKLAHVARLIYLDTGMDDALIVQARKIAHRLQIPLKVHSAGLDHVRTGLMNAIYRENVNEHTVN
jgi:hypothetical protein